MGGHIDHVCLMYRINNNNNDGELFEVVFYEFVEGDWVLIHLGCFCGKYITSYISFMFLSALCIWMWLITFVCMMGEMCICVYA